LEMPAARSNPLKVTTPMLFSIILIKIIMCDKFHVQIDFHVNVAGRSRSGTPASRISSPDHTVKFNESYYTDTLILLIKNMM